MGANFNHLPKFEKTFTKKEVRKLLKKLASILEDKARLAIHSEIDIGCLYPKVKENFLEEFDYNVWIKEQLN